MNFYTQNNKVFENARFVLEVIAKQNLVTTLSFWQTVNPMKMPALWLIVQKR